AKAAVRRWRNECRFGQVRRVVRHSVFRHIPCLACKPAKGLLESRAREAPCRRFHRQLRRNKRTPENERNRRHSSGRGYKTWCHWLLFGGQQRRRVQALEQAVRACIS